MCPSESTGLELERRWRAVWVLVCRYDLSGFGLILVKGALACLLDTEMVPYSMLAAHSNSF
jgi:hypothetical protein